MKLSKKVKILFDNPQFNIQDQIDQSSNKDNNP